MKDPVAENSADLKNVPCGNDCFSVKFFDTWRVRDQNVTCQETWRVGGCHVPDTSVVASGLGRSCATYQGKPGLWYLTTRGVSLIGPVNSRNSSNFRTCVSYVLFRNLHHFVNGIECILLRILRGGMRLQTYLRYSSFDSRCAFPTGVYTFYAFLLSFRLLLNIFVFTVYLSQGSFQIPACPPLSAKKTAIGHSLHLTDLRGGSTHQIRKAWERNALRSVAWEDLHRDAKPI